VSSESLVSTAPHSGEQVWRGPVAGPAEVVAAVAAARAAQPGWEAAGLEARVAVLQAFGDHVRAGAEDLARLIALETGKPLWEARTEVTSVAAKVDISIAAFHERTPQRLHPDGRALRHRPHGVLAVLGPYNFPAHLPNGHIVPALLAGNAIVFKPSEHTPATGEWMARAWAAAGLPAGLLHVVQGGPDTGRALAAAEIDGLLFTGSARGGQALARAFAETPWRILALEMGGNNPLVAWDLAEADVETAAAIIVQSAFLSAGQRCTCARRLIIETGPRGDRLVEAVDALAGRLIVGAPFDDPQPFMGPVIHDAAARGLLAAQAARLAAGGRAIRAMARPIEDRPFLTPGILDMTGAAPDDEEQFGPLLSVIRVAGFGEAMAVANATRFGLSAALVGGDRALYDRFWAMSRAGVVNWNRPTTGAASSAPFGGVGWSGNHRPSAFYAADYCAWPVAGIEIDRPEAAAMTGLRG
jgi:succinylglutamic semialdehyde dehydrogenase